VIVDSTTYAEPNTTLVGSVPEPSTFLMLAAGLLVLGGLRGSIRRRLSLQFVPGGETALGGFERRETAAFLLD